MNRLSEEQSPYLLQHKKNPVDWYPWGEEAFEAAKNSNRPILVSIGYSSCHWCHVMERESFEDEQTAKLMNEHFINIKVDREEHPAVDNYFMSAVQVLSGSGGWPLNCFLTPDLKPYFGGTYFPPKDMHGRPSWEKVVRRMAHAYQERQEEVLQQAEKLSRLIEQGSDRFVDLEIQMGEFNRSNVDRQIHTIKNEFDEKDGGLGDAPKFPSPHIYQFLLNYAVFDHDEELKAHLKRTAHSFIDGGLFDPVRGGFARYCVDREWKVPHFEKMLYDNAGILSLLSQMHSFLPDGRWEWAINKTIDFLREDMRSASGLFYAAIDADSEGEEGKFYTWTYTELESHLTKAELDTLEAYAEISEDGNWEGKNILYTRPSKRIDFFEDHSIDQLDDVFAKLKKVAQERTYPAIDDKLLLDWNAMMISALLLVDRYLDKPDAREMALNNLDRLLELFIKDQKVAGHVFKNDKVYADVVLDDYSYLIEALIKAYETTFDFSYIERAESLTQQVFELFDLNEQALFHFSASTQSSHIGAQPTYFDSPYPCGNSIMADNLRKLGLILDKPQWKARSQYMLSSLKKSCDQYPSSFAKWCNVGLFTDDLSSEVAVIGKDHKEWGYQIAGRILPDHILAAAESRQAVSPLLDRKTEGSANTIYLCQNYTCHSPVHNLEDFVKLKTQTLNY